MINRAVVFVNILNGEDQMVDVGERNIQNFYRVDTSAIIYIVFELDYSSIN